MWLRDAYGGMLLGGGIAGLILLVVGFLTRGRFHHAVNRCLLKIQRMKYKARTDDDEGGGS
jgi:hypothetical protein